MKFALTLSLVGFLCYQASQACGQVTPTPIPAIASPQDIGTQILHHSLHEAVWGPPVACDLRQTIHVYNRKMTGFGRYVRGGGGFGKLRMSLQLPAGDQMNTLLQVSDGDLLYSMENIGGVAKRTRVDLEKVRSELTITNELLNDPIIAMYLAIGGQAELLRKLCQQYEWTKVEVGELGGEPVWWLTGKLASNPPQRRPVAEIDLQLFVENQSALLPTDAILAVGRLEAAVPYWLYQVEQFRSEERVTPLGHRSRLSISTEWANPTILDPAKLDPSLFESKSTNEVFQEENRLYLPPKKETASVSNERLR
jgi:hypothetical protein